MRPVISVYEGVKQESKKILRICVAIISHNVAADNVTKLGTENMLSDLLYADDFVWMSETIDGLKNNIRK